MPRLSLSPDSTDRGLKSFTKIVCRRGQHEEEIMGKNGLTLSPRLNFILCNVIIGPRMRANSLNLSVALSLC